MEIDENFRRNLKRLREQKGYDAKTLSKMAELGERGVKDIEEGRSQSPKISTAFKLAKALDVDMFDLLGVPARSKIIPEMEDFLAQYGPEDQARLLAGLAAIPRQPTS